MSHFSLARQHHLISRYLLRDRHMERHFRFDSGAFYSQMIIQLSVEYAASIIGV